MTRDEVYEMYREYFTWAIMDHEPNSSGMIEAIKDAIYSVWLKGVAE